MADLLLLPSAAAAHSWAGEEVRPSQLVFSVSSWAAQILTEAGYPYRQNHIVEWLAVRRAVNENRNTIQFLKPLLPFMGLISELHSLFQDLTLERTSIQTLPAAARSEIEDLWGCYQQELDRHQCLDFGQQAAEALTFAFGWQQQNSLSSVSIHGLLVLAPLQEKVVIAAAQGLPRQTIGPGPQGFIEARDYPHSGAEVEAAAEQLRQRAAAGASPRRLGVALADPGHYLPIVNRVFRRLQIPWQKPGLSLADTWYGRAVLALVETVFGAWHKEQWQRLTEPGWGWPWPMNPAGRRRLRLAPPLRRLEDWRAVLDEEDVWKDIFDHAAILKTQQQPCGSSRDYASWLLQLLQEYPASQWPAESEEQWAQLLKAERGLEEVLAALAAADLNMDGSEFLWFLRRGMEAFLLPKKKSFYQEVVVGSPEQISASNFDEVFVLGLSEGTLPHPQQRHWLTQNPLQRQDDETLRRFLLGSGKKIHLSFARSDAAGRSQVPSPWLTEFKPRQEQRRSLTRRSGPELRFGFSPLKDVNAAALIRNNLASGQQSASRLQAYVDCPYKYFCAEVLNLKPSEEETEEISALEEGTLIHQVLQMFWEHHQDGPLPDWSRARQTLADLEADPALPWNELSRRRREQLHLFIRHDVETMPAGYRPHYLEKNFDKLAVDVDGETIYLRGKIDRIDRNTRQQTGLLLDYKTGVTPSASEVRGGEDLQLPLYLLAAGTIDPNLTVVGIAYYSLSDRRRTGVWLAPHNKLWGLDKRSAMEEDEWDQFRQQLETNLKQCLRGILAMEFPIQPRNEKVCRYCPYRGICRREVS